jgi:hypothetical protein
MKREPRFFDNQHADIVLGSGHQSNHKEEQDQVRAIMKNDYYRTVHKFHDYFVVSVRY